MSMTVLVIEDDLELNELLGEYLTLEGIRYLQATSGEEGIHLATTQRPDAVILDLMLPDVDGFQVARTLSTQRTTYDIPIVILSCMCQECDRQKGFASGALFFMNKPFLPDEVLTKVREAFAWRAQQAQRTPAGVITMGGGAPESAGCSQSTNQMVADLFARTELGDAAVNDIREAFETLSAWAREWNTGHAGNSHMKIEYRIQPAAGSNGGGAEAGAGGLIAGSTIEWKLSEDAPGMLAEAFFKPAPATAETSAWSVPGNLMGWGGAAPKTAAPITPPNRWLQVLAKTGAARFEKDSRTQTVRFVRAATNGGGVSFANGQVPVVEIDGTRYPTRLRDEALAAKRK